MIGLLPKMMVMSARGRGSFTCEQLALLERTARLCVHTVTSPLSADDFVVLCGDAEVVGITRRAIPDVGATLIARLTSLRGLAIHATGTEWIDLDAVAARGIAFASLPEYSTDTVAEHALAMMLNLGRRIHVSDRVARGDLPGSVSLRGWELQGKQLGIIGLGRIGSRVARLASAFGMRLAYHDPAVPVADGLVRMSLHALLACSDVVLVACSQKRDGNPILGAAEIAGMRTGSYLVNPARSQLVDAAAVLLAIQTRQLAGYAVDDRTFAASQLAQVEPGRILQTGHTAWYSDETIARGMRQWVAALVGLAEGAASG